MLIIPLSLYAEITRKGGNPKIRTYGKKLTVVYYERKNIQLEI